ncbi:MAG: DegT/DnrJ/EryC1/StrS family aminotransferase [Aggregatilineales bacterium]
MNITIAKPYIGDAEKQAVLEVLESGQLTQGKYVADFEQAFADYHDAKHGIATSNGTTALIASLMAHEIGHGDEVILPSFSFFSTASSVLQTGATPVFADIDPQTYCMSPEAVEALITEHTKAIMPVHLFGQPADMPAFDTLCQEYNLILLEDAAQAHGAAIGNRYIGTYGTASFSFYATKNIMTTEGGMVLTNDDGIAERLRMVRNHGMNGQYYHEVMGFNYRMTNLVAAIGLQQVNRLCGWTKARQANAAYFDAHITGVEKPFVTPGYQHAYHQYTIRLENQIERDAMFKGLNAAGIGARVYYPTPIHKQPVIQKHPGYVTPDLPETEKACQQVLSLPVHPGISQPERDYIVEHVNKFVMSYAL